MIDVQWLDGCITYICPQCNTATWVESDKAEAITCPGCFEAVMSYVAPAVYVVFRWQGEGLQKELVSSRPLINVHEPMVFETHNLPLEGGENDSTIEG